MDDLEREQGIPPIRKTEQWKQWNREFQVRFVEWWNSPELSEYLRLGGGQGGAEEADQLEEEGKDKDHGTSWDWPCW